MAITKVECSTLISIISEKLDYSELELKKLNQEHGKRLKEYKSRRNKNFFTMYFGVDSFEDELDLFFKIDKVERNIAYFKRVKSLCLHSSIEYVELTDTEVKKIFDNDYK